MKIIDKVVNDKKKKTNFFVINNICTYKSSKHF
jgi:hypothetical protein